MNVLSVRHVKEVEPRSTLNSFSNFLEYKKNRESKIGLRMETFGMNFFFSYFVN